MSQIYYSETNDRRNFISKIVQIFKAPLDRAEKIFIKPNIVSAEPYPTTTHPEVLDTLLTELSDHEIIVGDAPAIDAGRSGNIIAKSPLKQICKEHQVSLVNLYSEPMKRLTSERGYSMKVSSIPLSCDFALSVPVLKIHNMCGLSGALKNQFGYLSRTDRILMHTKIKDIQKGIAEVNAVVHTDLFIVDAVQTMIKAQEYRHGGTAANLGIMMAGTDPVSLDCFGYDLLEKVCPELEKTKSSHLKYLEYAAEYGVGKTKYVLQKILEIKPPR